MLQHGAYISSINDMGDEGEPFGRPRCPVVVGDLRCTMPPVHRNLECRHVTESGSTMLGVIPVSTSIAMHNPVSDQWAEVSSTPDPVEELVAEPDPEPGPDPRAEDIEDFDRRARSLPPRIEPGAVRFV